MYIYYRIFRYFELEMCCTYNLFITNGPTYIGTNKFRLSTHLLSYHILSFVKNIVIDPINVFIVQIPQEFIRILMHMMKILVDRV